jgi:hypothetical protein
MLFYDDRDFYNPDNIDELLPEEETVEEVWEYDYHILTQELIDD